MFLVDRFKVPQWNSPVGVQQRCIPLGRQRSGFRVTFKKRHTVHGTRRTVSKTHRLLLSLYILISPFALCLMFFPPVTDAATVTIGWDRCQETDIVGYKVHYGTTSGNYYYSVDVGNYDSCTISGLTEGQTYYFAATSYTVDNIESVFSTELVHTISTSAPTNPVAGADDVKIWIEAENGNINYPFDYGWDAEALSDGFIWVPNGTGNYRKPSNEAGYAEYVFEVSTTGDYVIWGRVLAESRKDDSFYVSVDSSKYVQWNTKRSRSWIWDQVSSQRGADPVIYHLRAGSHSLTVKQREDGTKLDRILITDDLTYIPQ